ncbi:oxidoreductase [Mycetocola lacteus]|uniref:Oxidoreductase n=1 Tax=Mycetocola lacteus TaxID=76637 RepID=A0A3L7AU93_9MICO|nr:oxidoreductase [Mycetocola lacteus]RLP84083.1 oxidoreductase [Mycetocola lacteus]
MNTENARFPLGEYRVSRTGYGAMQLTGPGIFGPPADHDRAIAVLRTAIELGVDHIDTAQYYGPDVVNELIREALHPYADNLAIVSKVGAARGPRGEIFLDNAPDRLRAGIEDNLRTLGIERLAAVNLRMPDQGAAPDALFDDQLAAMIQAREDGLIAGVGLSNINRQHLEHALSITEVVTVQNSLSLGDRSSMDVLELTTERGISFAPFLPLGRPGVHRGPIESPLVQRIATDHGISPAQVVLAWLLALAPNIVLIPGTGSLEHLRENLAAGDVILTADEIAALNGLTR